MLEQHFVEILVLICGTLFSFAIMWLVREVLSLRKDMTELAMEIKRITARCVERGNATIELTKLVRSIDVNVIRLCQSNGVHYEEPK